MKRSAGFTIVELLTVIVVIAVLAAISIVAYNGIQQRARNSQTASAVHAYQNALAEYAADNNAYPTLSPGNSACIGEDYPSNTCWRTTSGTYSYAENSTFNTALKTYLGSTLPMPGNPPTRAYNGIVYIASAAGYRLDSVVVPWIVYALDAGDTATRCPVGPIASYTASPTAYDFSSTTPATGQSTAGSATLNATCWIPLR